ncbi:hypothetical protein ACFYNL_17740 [Streptomyces sp. NPDC007808]|uniref:DUF7144 family membrane protein n=1 Tax=Streptomyces sp. NPDC007808 TaxID=3364779 RepID=UPI0036B7A57A
MSQQQPQSRATDAAHSPSGTSGPPESRAAHLERPWAEGGPAPAPSPAPAPGWATGGLVFAGVLMVVNGLLAVLQGISAIAEDDVYRRVGDYVFEMNLTGWGWTLLVLGVVVAAVGFGILRGAWWARVTGIFVASLGLVLHFLFLPYTPAWSVIMVGIDFFVILALALAPDVPEAGADTTGSAGSVGASRRERA